MTQAELQQCVEAVYRRLEQALECEFRRPTVSFQLRGLKAGTAHPGLNELRFNPVLAAENPDAYRQEVVPHEVAHLVAYSLCGPAIRPHGREWKQVMAVLGAPARATHQLDVSNSRVRRVARPYQYACACQVHGFTARRHRNAQAGSRYRCRRCKADLRLLGA